MRDAKRIQEQPTFSNEIVSRAFLTICNLLRLPRRLHNIVLEIPKGDLCGFISHMRRFFFQIGLLAVLPVLAWSQIALVHVTTCGAEAFPGTCTIPATGSGHLIVVGLQLGGGVSTSTTFLSVTDNAGNIYAEAGAARSIDTGASTVIDIWYAKNSVAGATSLTISPSAGFSNAGAVIWEFSGVDTSSPLDRTAVLNSQSSTTTPSGAPVSITSPGEVIISIAEVANTATGIVSGNAFTNDSTLMSNGWAHLITSSTGTYSPQWTQDQSGTYDSSTASFKAATSGTGPSSACDLATPYGTIDNNDVQAAINMTIGISPCTANIGGAGICNAAVVQRVINASLPGGTCVTGAGIVPHYVTLNWVASTTPNVTYNVYRSTTSGVYPPTPFASSGTATTYTDMTVTAGVTYYYVVTAVSGSSESGHSNETPATIPTP